MIVSDGDYMIGLGMPNLSGCANAWSYDCALTAIPSGTVTNPTRILGKNWNTGCATKPVFWGTESMGNTNLGTFNMTGASNIEIQCIEITDKDDCGFGVDLQSGSSSHRCPQTYGSGSLGQYQRGPAIYSTSGSNYKFQNLDIHGLGGEAIRMGNINGIVIKNSLIDGNYGTGWNGDVGSSSSMSGNILIDKVKTRFNGCKEAYPRSSSFTVSDYTACFDLQNNFGQSVSTYSADGWGFYFTGGTWLITNSEWSGNMSDGLDLLYGQNTLDVYIDKSAFFANAGNQLKIGARVNQVTNSIMIANCDYHLLSGKATTSTHIPCRAVGGVAMTVIPNAAIKFYNNTVVTSTASGGSSGIEWGPANSGASGNGSETYDYKNNIFIRSPSATNWNVLYIGGISGAALTAWNNATLQYNVIYNFQNQPSGTGNTFTNPNLTGSVVASTYDNRTAITNPNAAGASTPTNLTYWNNSNDYNNFPRGAEFNRGAYEQGSDASYRLAQSGQACIATSDCATGTCDNFACTGSCTANGGACSSGNDCCSAFCNGSSVCANPTTCGDGTIQPNETCDTAAAINSTCILQGFTGGTLFCSPNCLSYDTAACTNTVTFPLSPILDSFTRSDGAIGSNWNVFAGGFNVSSNAIVPTTANLTNIAIWAGSTFGADQEVYTTITNGGTNSDKITLYFRGTIATQNAYVVLADPVASTITLYTFLNGTLTEIGSASQSMASGDSIGASAVGSAIKVFYKDEPSGWAQIISVNNSDLSSGGSIGIGSPTGTGTPNITFDNFGGGNINPVVCGNGVTEPGEICDGADLVGASCVSRGYASGTLACATNCLSYDETGCTSATCGNNIREGDEVCDGTDVSPETCQTQGFNSGTLTCDSCATYNTSSCSNASRGSATGRGTASGRGTRP